VRFTDYRSADLSQLAFREVRTDEKNRSLEIQIACRTHD
jgi:hypothetical protein